MGAFHITLMEATSLTALNVLAFGLGNILWVPLMRAIGKRPVYLMAIALVIAANAWSATAASYASLLASRIISGIGASAADAPVPSTIGDLWTQKTRAHRGMVFHFFLASGIFLGPLINAWVIQLHGWRWVPGWISIVSGFMFVLAFFLIHETEYRDHRTPTTDRARRRPFKNWLPVTLGLNPGNLVGAFWASLKDIFIMTTYLHVLYSSIIIGIFVGWTIIMQISLSQTLSSPPYRWQLGHVGYFHFAGWIGVLFALPLAGWRLDKYMANRRAVDAQRHGNEERARGAPKYRLPFLIFPFFIAPTGLLIYGILLGHHHGWIGPAFGYAMHSFGFAATSNILVSWVLETNPTFAGEGLVSLFVIRNAIAVACTYGAGAGGWLSGKGSWVTAFGAMAAIEWFGVAFGWVMFLAAANVESCTDRYGPGRREAEERQRKQDEKRARQAGRTVQTGAGEDAVELQNLHGRAGPSNRPSGVRGGGGSGYEQMPAMSGRNGPFDRDGFQDVPLNDDVEAGRHARR